MSEPKPKSVMRSLERAIDVLEVLEASRSPLRLSEVARRAGLHVATAQRLLATLESRGRVEQGPSGYRTGVAMLFGAHAFLATNPVAVSAPPVLQELAVSTGLTASVFVRVGSARAVVARVEGANPLRYALPIGERLPLHLGAGKALAAFMDRAEVSDLLSEVGDFSYANGRPRPLESLLEELALIRDQGWCYSVDERVVGASSVASPVISPGGASDCAVQVAGPSSDPKFDDVARLSVEVRQASAALATRLS
ncbi:MAG: IclR family transcriptional regulator [Ornithinimicrobium sp.]